MATQALKHLSLKIGSLWVQPHGFVVPPGKTPDVATADAAIKLIEIYARARAEYDAKNYLAAIQIATEDET